MKYTTSDGKVWYLFCKEVQLKFNKRLNYYFKKTSEIRDGELPSELPIGYKVFESIVGMPMLKKG